MKQIDRCLVLAMGMTALLAHSAAGQEWSPAQREVWEAVEALWAASESGSAAAWSATISDDYRGMSVNEAGPTTKAQGRAWRQHYVTTRTTRARTLIPLSIDIHGDVAIVFYGYQLIMETDAEGETFESGRWMDVYRNTDGRWLLIADYGGAITEE
jgi:ketosteroid isomerase-like protein